jgi:multicomponent Na+:H+ antiporter subunit E
VTTPNRRDLAGQLLLQLPLLVALILLWALLWGSLSPLTLVTGLAVALALTRIFYLPPVALSGRFNVLWFAVFAARFALDLVIASFQVAFQAIAPWWHPRSSIIAVQLHTKNDLVISLTAMATSLVPGSLVVEIDRERSIIYQHALHTADLAAVAKVRRHTLGYERMLLLAFGNRDDVRRIRP